MKLPAADKAFVDIRKLRDYCLNPDHPRGKHKARVFATALGMGAEHAEELREVLLTAAVGAEAVLLKKDQYGRRYLIECPVSGPTGNGVLRSLWIVRQGEEFPRLLTCYLA